MVEYQLGNSFQYYHNRDIIGIGGLGYANLTIGMDKDKYISDALTHEFIHYLLHREFNLTTCKLYDTIGDSLRNKRVLQSVFEHSDFELWSTNIVLYGIEHIYERYHIDNIDLIQAFIICNTR